MWKAEWGQILENLKIWQKSINYGIWGALLISDWGKNGVEGMRLEQEAKREDVEQRNPSHTVGRKTGCYSHDENQYGGSPEN